MKPTRSCDGCNACCEGWLYGEAHGHKFWAGNKCHFLDTQNKRCSIYADRPNEPCKSFKCTWLTNENVPEWLKPNQSKVILVDSNRNGISYLSVTEAGQKLDAEILSWIFINFARGNIVNVAYQVSGGWNYIGSNDFIKEMEKK